MVAKMMLLGSWVADKLAVASISEKFAHGNYGSDLKGPTRILIYPAHPLYSMAPGLLATLARACRAVLVGWWASQALSRASGPTPRVFLFVICGDLYLEIHT